MNAFRPLSIAFALLLAACSSKVTAENYAQIKTGMSRADVHALLGEPDDASGSAIGNVLSLDRDVWTAGGKTLTVTYGNDRVALKSFE